jgi:hypothetical protein
MKFAFRFTLLLSILALCLGISSAQSVDVQAPLDYLMSYINRLNTGDYATAYSMIENRSDTYEDFVAGYEHTVRIVPYFGFTGAAAGSSYVTTVLLGYQDDGSIESYYGYFQMHSSQMFAPIPSDTDWIIGSARFRLLSDDLLLSNASIDALLATAWDETVDVSDELLTLAQANSESTLAMMDYYDLISTGGYDRAYNTWLSLQYLAPYADFVAGYADTEYVTVYAGSNQAVGTTSYFYTPMVLVSEHSDGSFDSYSGCYVFGRFNAGNLGIVNGKFTLLLEEVPDSTTIFDTLTGLNCSSLGIRY